MAMPIFMPARGAQIMSVDIRIPGEKVQTADSNVLLVAGVMHWITIETDAAAIAVKLIAHNGTQVPAPGERNESNYYEWEFDNGAWTDILYGRYIDTNRCFHNSSNSFVFAVGIHNTPSIGQWDSATEKWLSFYPWTLEIYLDGALAQTNTLSVRLADYGIGGSLDSYTMVVPPFSTNPVKLSQFYPVSSLPYVLGAMNIPVTINASYDILGSQFSIENLTTPLHIGDIRTLDALFVPPPNWSPRRNTVTISLTTSADIIPSASTISLIKKYETEMKITVEVKRAEYDLLDLGNGLMVEYRKGPIYVPWQGRASLSLYLVGTETIDLEISGDNLTVESVTGGTAVGANTVRLELTNTTEHEVNITFVTDLPDTAAFVIYKVRRGSVQENPFYTQIRVGPGSVSDPGGGGITSNPYVIGALLVGVTMAILLAAVYMRREKAKRRELARKKKKRKGGAR